MNGFRRLSLRGRIAFVTTITLQYGAIPVMTLYAFIHTYRWWALSVVGIAAVCVTADMVVDTAMGLWPDVEAKEAT